jgi:photosystem II stability/assembly factor-like uncharacterized protein
MKKLFFLVAILSINNNVDAQWISQATGFIYPTRGINEIKIVDANTVWARAYDGETPENYTPEFTRTIDGGKTWVPGVFNISKINYRVNNISPVSGTTAWLSAIENRTPTPGGVWKTTNGGLTWVQKNVTAYKNKSSYLNGVHFFDENIGISYGDPIPPDNSYEIYKTIDGGETWTAIPASATPAPESGEFGYNSIETNTAAGGNFWIGTNKGNILRSKDMGSTWTKLKSPITDFSATAESGILKFSDNNNGVIFAQKTVAGVTTLTLYKTIDDGETWSNGEVLTIPYNSFSYIPATSKIVGVGFEGDITNRIFYTGLSNDNGSTWTVIESGDFNTQKTVVSFLNENTGWAGGFNQSATAGGIFKFNSQPLSVASFNTSSTFSVSPIPTTGNIKLSSAKSTIGKVTIHNVLGKEVFNNKFSNLNNEVNIDLSGIDKGIYFLKATAQSGAVETIKVIKE